MSFDRLIDLYQLLASHSTLASRGLRFRLEGDAVKVWKGDVLIGKWTYQGEAFIFSRPCCHKRVSRETVTQTVNYVVNDLECCCSSS